MTANPQLHPIRRTAAVLLKGESHVGFEEDNEEENLASQLDLSFGKRSHIHRHIQTRVLVDRMAGNFASTSWSFPSCLSTFCSLESSVWSTPESGCLLGHESK